MEMTPVLMEGSGSGAKSGECKEGMGWHEVMIEREVFLLTAPN
ncbi:MAG: hypothetical protein ACI8T1_000367 [Verrucomicrobiales bacterium]|jgi:hypothetical protein